MFEIEHALLWKGFACELEKLGVAERCINQGLCGIEAHVLGTHPDFSRVVTRSFAAELLSQGCTTNVRAFESAVDFGLGGSRNQA